MRMQSSGSMLGEKAVPKVWRDRNTQWGYEQAEYHSCSWKAEGSKISNLSHWIGHKAVRIIPETCSLTVGQVGCKECAAEARGPDT